MKVNVQLAATGPITEMDDSELERHDLRFEDERNVIEVTEYWLPGTFFENAPQDCYLANRPHRSVHVKPKHVPT